MIYEIQPCINYNYLFKCVPMSLMSVNIQVDCLPPIQGNFIRCVLFQVMLTKRAWHCYQILNINKGFLLFVTVVVVVITIVHISMVFIVNTFTIIVDIITIINIVYTCMVRRLLKHFLSSYTSFYITATFFLWFPIGRSCRVLFVFLV